MYMVDSQMCTVDLQVCSLADMSEWVEFDSHMTVNRLAFIRSAGCVEHLLKSSLLDLRGHRVIAFVVNQLN